MTRHDPNQGSRYWGLIRRQGEAVPISAETGPSKPPPVPAKPKWPCQALHCKWKGEATDCPEHGIAMYYKRKALEGLYCYAHHGSSCNKGCGNSGD